METYKTGPDCKLVAQCGYSDIYPPSDLVLFKREGANMFQMMKENKSNAVKVGGRYSLDITIDITVDHKMHL